MFRDTPEVETDGGTIGRKLNPYEKIVPETVELSKAVNIGTEPE